MNAWRGLRLRRRSGLFRFPANREERHDVGCFVEQRLNRLVLVGTGCSEQLEPEDAIIGVSRREIAVPMKIVLRPGPREGTATRGKRGRGFHQRRLNGQCFRRLGERRAEFEDADRELFSLVSELIGLV